jgi:hypothetical protein
MRDLHLAGTWLAASCSTGGSAASTAGPPPGWSGGRPTLCRPAGRTVVGVVVGLIALVAMNVRAPRVGVAARQATVAR